VIGTQKVKWSFGKVILIITLLSSVITIFMSKDFFVDEIKSKLSEANIESSIEKISGGFLFGLKHISGREINNVRIYFYSEVGGISNVVIDKGRVFSDEKTEKDSTEAVVSITSLIKGGEVEGRILTENNSSVRMVVSSADSYFEKRLGEDANNRLVDYLSSVSSFFNENKDRILNVVGFVFIGTLFIVLGFIFVYLLKVLIESSSFLKSSNVSDVFCDEDDPSLFLIIFIALVSLDLFELVEFSLINLAFIYFFLTRYKKLNQIIDLFLDNLSKER